MYWSILTHLGVYCTVDTLHVLVCHLTVVDLLVAQDIEALEATTTLPEHFEKQIS